MINPLKYKKNIAVSIVALASAYGIYLLIKSNGYLECENDAAYEVAQELNRVLILQQEKDEAVLKRQAEFNLNEKKSQLKIAGLQEKLNKVQKNEDISHDDRMSYTVQLLNEAIDDPALRKNPLPPITIK